MTAAERYLEGPLVVFRIQDGEGRGPWKPGFSHRWVEYREDHRNLVPWFVEFGNVHLTALDGEHIGSACRTLDQLRRWFTPSEYATLQVYGYRAVRMEVGRLLAESAKQVLFGRAKPLNSDVIGVELYAPAPTRQVSHAS